MGLGAGMAVLHDGAEGQEAAPGPGALFSGGQEQWRRGTLLIMGMKVKTEAAGRLCKALYHDRNSYLRTWGRGRQGHSPLLPSFPLLLFLAAQSCLRSLNKPDSLIASHLEVSFPLSQQWAVLAG